DQPQGVQVAAAVHGQGGRVQQGAELFGGHVGQRTADAEAGLAGPQLGRGDWSATFHVVLGAGCGRAPLGVGVVGEVEVQQHRLTVVGEQDVGGLEVAVQDAAL